MQLKQNFVRALVTSKLKRRLSQIFKILSYQLDIKTLVDLMMLYNAIFFSDLCTKEAVGFYTLGRKLNEVKVEKVSIFNEFPKPFSLPSSSLHVCNHGLRASRENFFSKMSNFWAWADILGWNVLRHLGYFRPDYQHPFWYCEFLVHVFHYSTIISTKN